MNFSNDNKEAIIDTFSGKRHYINGLYYFDYNVICKITDGGTNKIGTSIVTFIKNGTISTEFRNVMFAVPAGFVVREVELSFASDAVPANAILHKVILEADEIITFSKNGTYTINTCRFNFNFE